MYSPADLPSSTRAAPAKKRMLSAETGISSFAAPQRLADVLRLDLRELVRVLLERVGELEQRLGALARSRLEPVRQRVLCRLDRAVDVGLGPARHLGDRLARRGVEHLHRAAVDGVDPLAADEVLVLRNRHAHRNPPGRIWVQPTALPAAEQPVTRASAAARSITGMTVSTITTKTTTFTSGSCWPRRILPRIQIGSVFCAPAVKCVTITSSNESAKASSAAGDERRREHRARSRSGRSASRRPRGPSTPRRATATCAAAARARCCRRHDAEGRVPDHDRPERERHAPRRRRRRVQRHPGDDPGSASGSTSRNEIDSRPKKRKRRTANGGHRPEHERDRRRGERRLEREPERVRALRGRPRRPGTSSA